MTVFIPVAIVALLFFLLLRVYCTCGTGESFDQQWPPIDDDQFMRRLPPGTKRDVALRVRRIIAEQTAVPYNQIYPEQTFFDDLDCC